MNLDIDDEGNMLVKPDGREGGVVLMTTTGTAVTVEEIAGMIYVDDRQVGYTLRINIKHLKP